ncbi:alpha-glucosidase [Haloferax mediterranei ATCC 33500]|uniref:Alpha-glucosidase n=1 Tax=Haloferax mediterranei (strain ATCC 33500 / DSM 1411 / JCM 8866 / NBRC 14739 / NCIMB 2177 / R-4) TaxID=523841 RepID=I3R3F0_HALMT|nr:alpha-glucosidase [Haloferax mediterranei]AFK18760.1 alpha-glucosidase [Haloferax mediterranei ATCC 33500]AHZ21871.1 oligo-1,6-glucosidase [Haloferax mediterranei ATCC 33500]EMA03380.1 alpha-glucosidase [Haloferax mediterranei ATCC 33500]MDX5988856.1 alpha-glucosidase [Haloferax mediterranei ATCC 33500]QCQ75255.1 alpha-glucosidase [Haloferax mediterranei ATCC 33500]
MAYVNSRRPPDERRWWKEAVVYQIYPRSFNDSDGNGVGDIPGIIEKVEYLDDLGVDCVWLNPVYESPGVDNGYDISDYRAILDEFGTMADWEALRDALHERDIRLIMDLVVNHTSDEHEWFVKSQSAKDSEYRDYYWWREGRDPDKVAASPNRTTLDPDDYDTPDGVNEVPPNDWESFFGGPAWTYDERTGEWYLHLFDERMPDVNWETKALREEMFEMMEWWLDRGIDGFRMDVINLISKPDGLPDSDDPTAIVRGADKFVNGPRIHEYLSEIYDRVLAGTDSMTVGEMADLTVKQAKDFVGEDGDGMSMVFTFDHMRLDMTDAGRWSYHEWSPRELKESMSHWLEGLADDGWNSLFLNNHDEPRMVSRFGDDGEYRTESAKLLATLLHTLRGTPYIYQGEELGMTNYPFDSLDEVRDVDTIKNVRAAQRSGRLADEDVMDLVRYRTRDNARTPMQWDDSPNADFTDPDTTPWMPVNPNKDEINAADARDDPNSIWHYYRDLISLRKERDVLVYGDYDLRLSDHERLWVYTRTLETDEGRSDTLLVVLNFGGDETVFEPPADLVGTDASLLISNYDADIESVEQTTLRPWEARVYDLA